MSTNVLTPFSYAEVETPEMIPEKEVENVVESGETPESGNEIAGEVSDTLWEVEWGWGLPLVSEVVNETSPAKQGENLEGLKEEVEDSLDAVESPTIDENKIEDTEKGEIDEVVQSVERNTEREKQEENLEDNNEITEQENVEIESQGLQKIQEISIMDTATNSKDIVLEATSTAANQTLKINKYFKSAYTVDWWDGSPIETVSADKSHTYNTAWTYTITLSLTWWVDRWTFQNVSKPLVPKYGTTVTWVKIIYMPSLADGFGANETNPGNYFFRSFNGQWALTSLPEWSFDTSKITVAWLYFFSNFNQNWAITSLPERSFDTSNITTVGHYFFSSFNDNKALTSLPSWSFDISNISWEVWHNFFSYFNNNWQLTSLPADSFNTSKITAAKDFFFSYFNYNWALTSLPERSFDISNITTVGNNFFEAFNQNWALTSLPSWSFDTSNITIIQNDYFFRNFNYNWALTSLPESFKLSSVAYNKYNAYQNAFNSSYTLNRNVSDLVVWVTAPGSDRNTFSDNQPWRCGVAANWLYNSYGACKVLYNPNGWLIRENSSIWTWNHYSYTTGASVQSNGLINTGYLFIWWYTASTWWTKITTVTFPDMDENTLYAHWYACFTRDGSTITNYNTWCGLSVKIPSTIDGVSITSIWANAFNSKWITSVAIPSSVTSIWASAFENNDLTEITIPDSVTTIWNNVFCNNSTNPIIWYKLSWTINNANNACITEPYINFHANGWKFDNNSDTKKVLATKTGGIITKHSSSPNRSYSTSTNSWVQNGVYGNDLDEYQTITITWATNLEINIHYAIECNYDYVNLLDKNWNIITEDLYWTIWYDEWVISCNEGCDDYEEICDEDDNCDEIYYNCSMYDETYTIPWDTVIFHFHSDGGVRYDGYYADIQGQGLSYSNPTVGAPTQIWYLWTWWYTNTGLSIPYVVWLPWSMDSTDAYAKWVLTSYTITFEDSSEENEKIVISWLYLSDTSSIKYPKWTKEWYKIVWDKEIPATMPAENMIIKASWEKNWSSGWWGGGWGWTTKPDTPKEEEKPADTSEQVPQNDNSVSSWANVKTPENDTQMDSQSSEQSSAEQPEWQGNGRSNTSDNSYTNEQKEAYEFAKENGITTKDTIQSAQMNGKLTRIAMAKMLSQYAINVLWQTPDTSKTIKFKDVTSKKDADYDNGVTLAYQLGIMWQNMPNNNFRPNDEVTRAEFATALSRMAYGTSDWEYKATSKYYIHHMEKLVKEWIITKDDPNMKELRWYVMIMLMRSAK